MKKCEFTDIKVTFGRDTLYRIRALRNFGSVKEGDLGGFLQKEENLSHDGDAWVCGAARVCGDAWVYGNAWVCDGAQVYGNAWVCDGARVYGNAQVYGNAWVCGDAQVYGNAWVCDGARVYGNAQVCDGAQVYGNARVCDGAQVYGNFDVLTVGPVGSRNDSTTFFRTERGISVVCGCFVGTLDEFAAKVTESHGDNEHAKAYELAIELAKVRIGKS
jgi:hypothetical protein